MAGNNLDQQQLPISSLKTEEVAKDLPPKKEYSISYEMYLIAMRRQKELLAQSKTGIEEIQEKGRKITKVNAASQAINACQSGDLDLTNNPELLDALKKAKEAGANINLDKTKYTAEERNRLLDNLRTTVETLSMQSQTEMQNANLLSQIFDSWAAAGRLEKTHQEILMGIERNFNR